MKISSLIDLEKIAKKIQKIITKGDFIFLYGEIGVGKTTFARLLINNYELKNKKKISEVLSPTFNIVFEYDINNSHIKHYDLYRLNNKEDIKNSKRSITFYGQKVVIVKIHILLACHWIL